MTIKQALHEIDSEIRYWNNKDGFHQEKRLYGLFVRILRRIEGKLYEACLGCGNKFTLDELKQIEIIRALPKQNVIGFLCFGCEP